MNDDNEKISDEERERLALYDRQINWLTTEADRLCRLIALGRNVKRNVDALFEVRERCAQLGREVEKYLERFT